ncbi:hypothetical protein MNV_480004 [Candidatus Methanoperedens nitroreducens]|uniref:Uncharacterized protein n=1 Tax=Candidatus Methanoperedens nitratireducens TaxID=1392998 RepID=A0A284VR80_9EURY|nr:hypothetical protein MNV_480004 [Candidatus Methanoperedens nitroreducens]
MMRRILWLSGILPMILRCWRCRVWCGCGECASRFEEGRGSGYGRGAWGWGGGGGEVFDGEKGNIKCNATFVLEK